LEYLYAGHLKALLSEAGLRPERSLGQNFLVNVGVVEAIIDAGVDAPTAVDIGAGPGILTLPLSHRYPEVVAVEIDARLAGVLRAVLKGRPNVHVVVDDARSIGWVEVLSGLGVPRPSVFFGNLPYYAAAPIMMRFLESGVSWTQGVFMLQREVADRLLAEPGGKDYGILTLAVRYHAQVRGLRTVSPGSFYPTPEVSSKVVILSPAREKPLVPFAHFMAIVRAGFGQRRKTVRNALRGSPELEVSVQQLDEMLSRAEVDPRARAETLHFDDFVRMAGAFKWDSPEGL